MENTIPVTFKDPGIPDYLPYTMDIVTGQIRPNKKTANYKPPCTLNCEVVLGDYINIIIIKSILPDEWPIIYRTDKNDRFGIPVWIDEAFKSSAVLAHSKIKAITILEKWRKPGTILKMTPHTTSARAWLERYGNVCVSIELADGTILRGNIEPCLKEKRDEIIKLEDERKVSALEKKKTKP